jgi:hypothetical protein
MGKNDVKTGMDNEHTCPICGGDKAVAEIAIKMGHRPDVAFAKLLQAQKSFDLIWDSVTDILSQKEIDRLERLHKQDFDNLLDVLY